MQVAAMDKNKKMGIGVIERDYVGEVLATLMAPKPYITDLVVAETMAALAAAVFTRDVGLQKVELESDAIQVVQALVERGNELKMLWLS